MDVLTANHDVILYGIGRNLEEAYAESKEKCSIVCFADKDKSKHGTAIKMSDGGEYRIMSLDNALRQYPGAKLWIAPAHPLSCEIMYDLINGTNHANKINKELIINFDADKYRLYWGTTEPKVCCYKNSNNTFYVEDIDNWVNASEKDYRIPPPAEEVQIVKNGIILPVKRVRQSSAVVSQGGVCDCEGSFIEGHKNQIADDGFLIGPRYSITSAYQIDEKEYHINETVVYGGVICDHFAHVIAESLSRMWWFLENRDSNYKFVFISLFPDNDNMIRLFYELLFMLGMKEKNIAVIKKPTRFDSIIIPCQTTFYHSGFREKAMTIYNTIRDSVPPARYDKVYLTRTKLPRSGVYNEEYFEDYYRSIGYEVIAPEQLSIREQISIAAGAKSIACVTGTLQHHILFCHDEVNITLLNRSANIKIVGGTPYFVILYFWINQARRAKCHYVDVYKSFLPSFITISHYLLGSTPYWKEYVKDSGGALVDGDIDPAVTFRYLNDSVSDIVRIARQSGTYLDQLPHYTFGDFIYDFYCRFLGIPIDEPTKRKIYESFKSGGVLQSE